MHISLEKFLCSGQLSDLTPGLSVARVRTLPGEPDAVGGISRKRRVIHGIPLL